MRARKESGNKRAGVLVVANELQWKGSAGLQGVTRPHAVPRPNPKLGSTVQCGATRIFAGAEAESSQQVGNTASWRSNRFFRLGRKSASSDVGLSVLPARQVTALSQKFSSSAFGTASPACLARSFLRRCEATVAPNTTRSLFNTQPKMVQVAMHRK